LFNLFPKDSTDSRISFIKTAIRYVIEACVATSPTVVATCALAAGPVPTGAAHPGPQAVVAVHNSLPSPPSLPASLSSFAFSCVSNTGAYSYTEKFGDNPQGDPNLHYDAALLYHSLQVRNSPITLAVVM
jgi:hypothetical protein